MMLVTNHATIKDNQDRTMIFDMFVKNKELIIIGSSPKPAIPIDKISVSINDIELKIKSMIIKDCYSESYRVFIFDCNYTDSHIQVTVNYDNVCKTLLLDNINGDIQNKYNLTITTCFQGDYDLFPMWYDYYTKQGVEHFYMYYNGILTDTVKDILNKPNVTLHEWCFNYWSPYGNRKHFAQLGQIQHALYKYGKNISEYMIFCDLDEYLYFHNKTILNKIISNDSFDQIQFRNCWCQRMDDTIPECFPLKFYIEDSAKLDIGRRKGLYKISNVNGLSVHCGVNDRNILENEEDRKKYNECESNFPYISRNRLNKIKIVHYGIMFHFKTSNFPSKFSFGSIIFPDNIPWDMNSIE